MLRAEMELKQEKQRKDKEKSKAAQSGKRWTASEERKLDTLRTHVLVDETNPSAGKLFDEIVEEAQWRSGWKKKAKTNDGTLKNLLKQKLQAGADQLGRSLGSVLTKLGKRHRDEQEQDQEAEEKGETNNKKRQKLNPSPTTTKKKKNNNKKAKSKKEKEEAAKEKQKEEAEAEEEEELKKDAEIPLGREQQVVFDAVVQEGKNVFFTGAAGSGKSYLLKRIVRTLRRQGKEVAVCAPTGLAACNIGGVTIHKYAGFMAGDEDTPLQELVSRTRMRKVFAERWRGLDVLVIDEISMVEATLFEKLDALIRAVRRSSAPFGGLQLILCGDFFQLPPVPQRNKEIRFCFEADNWQESLDVQTELHEIYRQSDMQFINMLNEIRIGQCSARSLALLDARRIKETKEDKTKEDNTKEIIPTRLFSHKKDVQKENDEQLAALTSDPVVFKALDTGKPNYRKTLDHDCLALNTLVLKIGAQVILLKNQKKLEGLAKGSRGVVIGFQKDPKRLTGQLPLIKFANGMQRLIEWEPFKVMLGQKPISCRTQLPLALGWAITFHRAQGMTLDRAEVTLAQCFEHGQIYVGLSRVRTLEGLSILSFNPAKVKAHPKVLAYHATFNNRS